MSGPDWTIFRLRDESCEGRHQVFHTLAATRTLFDQSQQNVFGADVFVIEAQALDCQLHDLEPGR